KGDAEYQDLGLVDGDIVLRHQLDHGVGDVGAHVVVDSSTRKNYFRAVSQALCLVGEVIGIYTNAMAADQAGFEGKEIPFRSSGLQDFVRIDPHPLKDQG